MTRDAAPVLVCEKGTRSLGTPLLGGGEDKIVPGHVGLPNVMPGRNLDHALVARLQKLQDTLEQRARRHRHLWRAAEV